MPALAEESIYNLLPPAPVKHQRNSRAVNNNNLSSKSRNAAVEIAPTYSTFPSQKIAGDGSAASLFQGQGANIGRLVGETIDPRNFLKKNCGGGGGGPAGPRRVILDQHEIQFGRRSLSANGNGNAAANPDSPPRIHEKRLPGIPTRTDKPVMGLQTDKNFIHANAVEAMCTAPRRLKKDEPRPTERQDFARVPSYLGSIKSQIEQEKADVEMVREYRTQKAAEQKAQFVRQMDEEERDYLSRGLRQAWAEKYRQYQALPFAKDTALQVSRKENLERELKEIEADLEKLERPVLYIHRDDTIGVAQYAKMQAMQESERTAKKMVKEAIAGSSKK